MSSPAKRGIAPAGIPASRARQLCTFSLDEFLFGVGIDNVHEVIRNQPITRIPLAPPDIVGLISLRGQIITSIDLRLRLELPPHPPGKLPVNLIVKHLGQAASLLVDRVEDVLTVDDDLLEPPPGTLKGVGHELIRGAYKLPDRLLLLLDVGRVVHPDSIAALTGAPI